VLWLFVERLHLAISYFIDVIGVALRKLQELESCFVHDPQQITREYRSPYTHCEIFTTCAMLLKPLGDDALGEYLTGPLFGLATRAECICLARLVAGMNLETCRKWFELIMDRNLGELIMVAGRVFINQVRISVFESICSETGTIVQNDPLKLDKFMKIVIPSYRRWMGGEKVAESVLCWLLKGVTANTPRYLQEAVFDVVGYVYVRLKLWGARQALIESAIAMAPA
jgi:hypothetical protein